MWDALSRHPFVALVLAIALATMLCLLWAAQEHAEEQRGSKK